jgi:hypothetical protein
MAEISMEAQAELREFVLRPALRSQDNGGAPAGDATRPRVIGPGRFERSYLQRLSGLTAELEAAREEEHRLLERLREEKSALEVSQRVEHGCQRRIDRLEGRLEQRTQALLESERQQKRLALALGSMQREVEMLRAQSALALAPPPPRASLWRRILGGRR